MAVARGVLSHTSSIPAHRVRCGPSSGPCPSRYPATLKAINTIVQMLGKLDQAAKSLDADRIDSLVTRAQRESDKVAKTKGKKKTTTKKSSLASANGIGMGISMDPTKKERVIDEKDEPEWELFDCQEDPLELFNVYSDPAYAMVVQQMTDQLNNKMKQIGDIPEHQT